MVQVSDLVFRADPEAGTPRPSVSVGRGTTGSPIEFSGSSVIGQSYQLQYRASLTEGVWDDLGPPIAGTGSP
jgi:hypothetical protein